MPPDPPATDRPRVAADEALAAAARGWAIAPDAVETSGIEPRDGGLLFVHDDPHLVLRFARPRRAGWYRLEAAMRSPVPLRPRAFLPERGGFSDRRAINLARTPDGRYTAFFRAPERFSAFRFDPADTRLEAAIDELALSRVGLVELGAAAARAARSAVRRRGLRGLVRFVGSALLTVLRPASFDSFDTVGGRPATPTDPVERYRRWVEIDEMRIARTLADFAAGLRSVPRARIRIVVAADGDAGAGARIAGLVASLGAQAGGTAWSLVVAVPPSVPLRRGDLPADPRVSVVATEAAAARALVALGAADRPDLVVLLPDDARLAPHALAVLAAQAAARPEADLFYADDDDLDAAGARAGGRFRPDWSQAHFEARDYLGPLIALRPAILERSAAAGFTDLVLDLAARPGAIAHVAEMPVHRARPEAVPAWREPPEERLARLGARADAARSGVAYEIVPATRAIRARQPVPDPAPMVSIVIPTRDRVDLLSVAVGSLLDRTRYPNYEVVVVDNGSTDPATLAWFEAVRDPRVRVLPYPLPFNYSAINNFAVERTRGEVLVLLNNDTEVVEPDWLAEMVGWALRPDVGAVGAKLHFPDGTIQHGGVVTLSRRGVAGHLHLHEPGDAAGMMDRLVLTQDLTAVTGACLALRRAVFDAVGGLDDCNLAVAFNDVDLCLRIRAAGLRVIWTPYAELVHHESVSRGSDMAPDKKARFMAEVDHMAATWGATLERDPFYSPHFERGNANFVPRID